MSDDLKPCPFCGLPVTLKDAGENVVGIVCPPGPCIGSELLIGFPKEYADKAIAAWNRRHDTRREALEAGTNMFLHSTLNGPCVTIDFPTTQEAEQFMAAIRALQEPKQ